MRRVIVIGAGLAGMTVAYELARRGYPTTLFERREAVAIETSYANGALLTPSMADPWNAPGVHRYLIGSLLGHASPVKLHASAIPSLLGWGWQFLRNSTRTRHDRATRASFVLAQYSLEQTRTLRADLSLHYDAATVGSMKVFESHAAMESSMRLAQMLATLGLRFEKIDADRAVELEPALAPIRSRIAGAIHFPDDEVGDARLFCEQLSDAFVRLGGKVCFGATIEGIATEGDRVTGVQVDGDIRPAEAVVVAAGNASPRLVCGLGVALPIRPAKGYTITFDVSQLREVPRIAIVHDTRHAAIVPIGTRLRLAGTAEFTGEDFRIAPDRFYYLYGLLEDLLPQLAKELPREEAQAWTGLRPMSADGLPFIGPARVRGLYVNSGHGHLGWTLAVGSAKLLADLLEGKPPAIDPAPYRLTRQA